MTNGKEAMVITGILGPIIYLIATMFIASLLDQSPSSMASSALAKTASSFVSAWVVIGALLDLLFVVSVLNVVGEFAREAA